MALQYMVYALELVTYLLVELKSQCLWCGYGLVCKRIRHIFKHWSCLISYWISVSWRAWWCPLGFSSQMHCVCLYSPKSTVVSKQNRVFLAWNWGVYADDNEEQLCSGLAFFSLTPVPLENMLRQNVSHGHCAAERATVTAELRDGLSHLSSFLHCHITTANQSWLVIWAK